MGCAASAASPSSAPGPAEAQGKRASGARAPRPVAESPADGAGSAQEPSAAVTHRHVSPCLYSDQQHPCLNEAPCLLLASWVSLACAHRRGAQKCFDVTCPCSIAVGSLAQLRPARATPQRLTPSQLNFRMVMSLLAPLVFRRPAARGDNTAMLRQALALPAEPAASQATKCRRAPGLWKTLTTPTPMQNSPTQLAKA
jgi:hypothetical protein